MTVVEGRGQVAAAESDDYLRKECERRRDLQRRIQRDEEDEKGNSTGIPLSMKVGIFIWKPCNPQINGSQHTTCHPKRKQLHQLPKSHFQTAKTMNQNFGPSWIVKFIIRLYGFNGQLLSI
ncbi:hypothetical protein Fot_21826 [Forsythia ovata]|uniref:Uncharacterized protein n=1 Tax=Forsythia ovata TaxID=205694 RepID=A0ABD1UVZ0_9LAMI